MDNKHIFPHDTSFEEEAIPNDPSPNILEISRPVEYMRFYKNGERGVCRTSDIPKPIKQHLSAVAEDDKLVSGVESTIVDLTQDKIKNKECIAITMSSMEEVKMDDRYEGFNDYDHAYDIQNFLDDQIFQESVTKSSYGRRPKSSTSRLGVVPVATSINRINNVISSHRSGTDTITGFMLRSSIGSRHAIEPSVPMTAVRGAGYSSAGRGMQNDVEIIFWNT
ncbi:Sua5/YciO/YrdC/YwlC family protein [Dirofilaria immitis]|nr:Sua5/YciO/YrdC/YwlC family protein [Dirofilaria immitis]